MTTFALHICDAARAEEIEGVTSFRGEDASGCFGILAGRARFMTTLILGLARFRVGDEPWRYLALPGGVLYFCNNRLTISTRHYLIDSDFEHISMALQQQLLVEEKGLHEIKRSLQRMEEEILLRLWGVERATLLRR